MPQPNETETYSVPAEIIQVLWWSSAEKLK